MPHNKLQEVVLQNVHAVLPVHHQLVNEQWHIHLLSLLFGIPFIFTSLLLSYIFASSSSLNYFLLTAIAYDSNTVFISYLRLLIGITLHYPANFLFFYIVKNMFISNRYLFYLAFLFLI